MIDLWQNIMDAEIKVSSAESAKVFVFLILHQESKYNLFDHSQEFHFSDFCWLSSLNLFYLHSLQNKVTCNMNSESDLHL